MQQNNDKHIKIIILITIVFVILGLFLVSYLLLEKRELLRSLDILRKNKEMTAAEIEKNKEAMEMGLVRSIDGKVISMGEDHFVIESVSSVSNTTEEYSILFDKGVKFSREVEKSFVDDEGNEVFVSSDEKQSASLAEIKEGTFVLVVFSERMNVDSGKELVASEVILPPIMK